MSDWALVSIIALYLAHKTITHWLDQRQPGDEERDSFVGAQAELAEPHDGHDTGIGFSPAPVASLRYDG